jgi:hypothetical protein
MPHSHIRLILGPAVVLLFLSSCEIVSPGVCPAWERPGRYDVVVQKSGYRKWVQTGVQVGRNSCGVEPVMLQAQLERLP